MTLHITLDVARRRLITRSLLLQLRVLILGKQDLEGDGLRDVYLIVLRHRGYLHLRGDILCHSA